MKVFQSAIVLAVCLVEVFALPDLSIQQLIDAVTYNHEKLLLPRSDFIEPRLMTPGQSACVEAYNNRTQVTNQQLHNATEVCFDNANSTNWNNNWQANETLNHMRSNLTQLQSSINSCLNLTDNIQLINCVQHNFNYHLGLLDTSNSLSYTAQAQLVNSQYEANINQTICITQALDKAKVANMKSDDEYAQCLAMVPNQRDPLQQITEQQQATPQEQIP